MTLSETDRTPASRRRPRYADVAATLALLLAVGGSGAAYASHLKVRTSDLAKAAVTTPKVANKAVKRAKIAPGAVTAAKIADGSVSAADLGFVPVADTEIITVNDVAQPGNGGGYYGSRFLTVFCPPGKLVVGGGFRVATVDDLVVVHKSGPNDAGTGWDVYVYNGRPTDVNISGYAVCAVR